MYQDRYARKVRSHVPSDNNNVLLLQRTLDQNLCPKEEVLVTDHLRTPPLILRVEVPWETRLPSIAN